jgi:hypothetical protein
MDNRPVVGIVFLRSIDVALATAAVKLAEPKHRVNDFMAT